MSAAIDFTLGARRLASGENISARDLILTPGNVQRMTDRLSHLRGAAMKMGQMISLDAGDFLPEELSKILATLRDQANFMPTKQLDAVLRAASPGGQVLAPLATRVPQGLQLTALALEGSALRLEGVAQGRASVTQLLRNLDQAPGLSEVQLQEIKATAAGEVFHLSAQVQP